MASITTLRGRPNGSLMSLARTLATTSSTSRGAMDTRGDGGPANTASATAGGGGGRPRHRPARGLAGKLHERAARRRAAPALPLDEQLGDQATQLIACER